MKTLFILRHAEALEAKEEKDDFKRMLSPQGVKNAKKIAKNLYKKGFKADFIISSPTDRASVTAIIFAKQIGYPVSKILIEDSLYPLPTEAILLDLVHKFDNIHSNVMICGHNPSLEEFAALLIKDFKESLPKASVLAINFNRENWQDIQPQDGEIAFFIYPLSKKNKRKMKKNRQKEVQEMIEQNLNNLFMKLDSSVDHDMEKTVKTTSQNLARKFVKLSGYHEIGSFEVNNPDSQIEMSAIDDESES